MGIWWCGRGFLFLSIVLGWPFGANFVGAIALWSIFKMNFNFYIFNLKILVLNKLGIFVTVEQG